MFETEKTTLRNSAYVGTVFAVLSVMRRMRQRARQRLAKGDRAEASPPGADPPLGRWEEMAKSVAGIGGATQVYGTVKGIAGREVAAVASLAPLRYFLDDPRLKLSYKFLVAFATGQAVVQLVPALQKHPILLMYLSTAQLLSWWLMSCRHLPRDYQNFLYVYGRISRERLLGFRELLFGSGTWKDFHPWIYPKAEGGHHEFDTEKPLTAVRACAAYFAEHLTNTIPFYLKVYLFRIVYFVVSGKKDTQLHTQAVGVVKDVLRSACFLSGFCTSAYTYLAFCLYLFPSAQSTPLRVWLMMGLASLPLLVETPSQQRTIASYCATFGAYPVLEHFDLFDPAAVVTTLLAAAGNVRTPLNLRLIWNEDPKTDTQKAALAKAAKQWKGARRLLKRTTTSK
ncbi:hypothetical protein DIPPA_35560 [Diplonema papillatum]|nr:hypothetical protein DIPPA_35560 [Diplonema papillatum]